MFSCLFSQLRCPTPFLYVPWGHAASHQPLGVRYLPRHTKRVLVGKAILRLQRPTNGDLWTVNNSFCIFLLGTSWLSCWLFISTQCLVVGVEKHICQNPKLSGLPRLEASKNKHLKFTCLKIRNWKMTECHPLSYAIPQTSSQNQEAIATLLTFVLLGAGHAVLVAYLANATHLVHTSGICTSGTTKNECNWSFLQGITCNSLMVAFANWMCGFLLSSTRLLHYFTITVIGWNLLE